MLDARTTGGRAIPEGPLVGGVLAVCVDLGVEGHGLVDEDHIALAVEALVVERRHHPVALDGDGLSRGVTGAVPVGQGEFDGVIAWFVERVRDAGGTRVPPTARVAGLGGAVAEVPLDVVYLRHEVAVGVLAGTGAEPDGVADDDAVVRAVVVADSDLGDRRLVVLGDQHPDTRGVGVSPAGPPAGEPGVERQFDLVGSGFVEAVLDLLAAGLGGTVAEVPLVLLGHPAPRRAEVRSGTAGVELDRLADGHLLIGQRHRGGGLRLVHSRPLPPEVVVVWLSLVHRGSPAVHPAALEAADHVEGLVVEVVLGDGDDSVPRGPEVHVLYVGVHHRQRRLQPVDGVVTREHWGLFPDVGHTTLAHLLVRRLGGHRRDHELDARGVSATVVRQQSARQRGVHVPGQRDEVVRPLSRRPEDVLPLGDVAVPGVVVDLDGLGMVVRTRKEPQSAEVLCEQAAGFGDGHRGGEHLVHPQCPSGVRVA